MIEPTADEIAFLLKQRSVINMLLTYNRHATYRAVDAAARNKLVDRARELERMYRTFPHSSCMIDLRYP